MEGSTGTESRGADAGRERSLPPAGLLACPRCRGPFGGDEVPVGCPACELAPSEDGGVLDLLDPAGRPERAREVTAFYEERPFPGYAEADTGPTLLDRLGRSPFLRALDAAAGPRDRVLDAGCGTGQLAAYLALAAPRRTVVGVDACRASLREADGFRARARVPNLLHFRADLFGLPFADGAFDLVLSRGVVHHTPDPEGATRSVARHVKPGGHLVLGYYESLGRRFHRFRMALSRATDKVPTWLDPVLRRRDLSPDQRAAWISDQYHHPLEELLPTPVVARWLAAEGFTVLRSIPPVVAHLEQGGLLAEEPLPRGARLLARRVGWLLNGPFDADAGLVFLVARRG